MIQILIILVRERVAALMARMESLPQSDKGVNDTSVQTKDNHK